MPKYYTLNGVIKLILDVVDYSERRGGGQVLDQPIGFVHKIQSPPSDVTVDPRISCSLLRVDTMTFGQDRVTSTQESRIM